MCTSIVGKIVAATYHCQLSLHSFTLVVVCGVTLNSCQTLSRTARGKLHRMSMSYLNLRLDKCLWGECSAGGSSKARALRVEFETCLPDKVKDHRTEVSFFFFKLGVTSIVSPCIIYLPVKMNKFFNQGIFRISIESTFGIHVDTQEKTPRNHHGNTEETCSWPNIDQPQVWYVLLGTFHG